MDEENKLYNLLKRIRYNTYLFMSLTLLFMVLGLDMYLIVIFSLLSILSIKIYYDVRYEVREYLKIIRNERKTLFNEEI